MCKDSDFSIKFLVVWASVVLCSMNKIVLVGGGTGVSELLREFQKVRNVKVSAIVTVFDDGGSTGKLRKNLKIPAVGDLRKCFSVATSKEFAEVLESRVEQNHAVGNFALAFLSKKHGFERGLEIYKKMLNSKSDIIPVSFESATLIGKLEGGSEIRGEKNFDYPPKKIANKKVRTIKLVSSVKLNPRVRKVLRNADKIIVGPGSLFGSLLVHFQVKGFKKAFAESKAKKILVINSESEFGYHGETAEDVEAHFPVKFGKIIKPVKAKKAWNLKTLVSKILK